MKKLIRIFWFSLLLLISNLSFSQTVTLTADYGMTNVSGVTNCGGGKYKFSFKQSAWQVCRFFVKINGTSTNDLGYTGVGCATSCWTPCRWQSSTSSQGSAVQYYLEVNTVTKRITMTTNNFTCSSATVPTITTTSTPSSISCTSASSGGSGITDGGSAITAKGVCWNTSTNPTISNSKTSNGIGTANFTSSITGLSPGVTYYVRAYATNAIGTSYGNVQSFTTSTIPAQPGTITGTATQCPSVGSQVYSITAVANATSYNWTVPTGWAINSGAGTNSITVTTGNAGQNGNISVTASNTCGTSTARTLAVTVSTATVAGSISGGTTVCSGSNSGSLTLSGHTGSVIRWQSSTNGTTWSNITNTTTTQSYTNLTTTTQYRAVVQSGVCSQLTTSPVTITVSPTTVAGSISGGTTVCSGSNSGSLTLSGHTGNVIRWQSSTNGTTWSNITNTTTTQSYTNLTTTTQYRAVVQSGVCSQLTTSPVTITVSPITVAGSISGGTTVCSGSNSGTLTLSGHTGNVIRWESSTNGTTWSNITNTTTTQSYTNLTTTTQYRAVVQSGSCSQLTTSPVTITVSPTTVAGSISGGTTVCSGSNSGSLTLSGHTGSILRWESSTNGTTWSSITNTTTSQSYTNLTTTTQYRAVVQSGSCSSVTTSAVSITVSPTTVAGSISGSTTVCSGSNSGSLTLSGHTGNVIRWESSTNGTTWSSITNTTTSQSYTNLTTTTQYRAVVQSGSCSSVTTSAVSITVSPITVAGSISGGTTVCSGSNSGTLTLSGHTGSILRWESSTDGTTWNSITNTTTTQSYTNLTTTTQYRAVVQSGSCSQLTTSPVTITVSPTTVAGSISGSTTVCSGSNSGSLTLSGHTGNVIRWESSTNGTTWSNITNTTITQSYTNLTTTTQYRAVVQSGSCSQLTTSPVTITVSPTTVAGSISGGTTVCSGSNSGSLTLSGHTGNVLRWESSTDGTTWNSITNTTTTQSYTNLTTTTQYRAVVQSGVCSELNTLSVTVTVYSDLTAGSISGNQTMCSGVSPDSIINITLPTGGNGIYTYQWQESTDNSSWSNISGQTLKDYFSGIVGTNTYYRRSVNSGDCPTKYTSSSLIKVNNCSGPGGVVSDVTLWLRGDTGTVTSSGTIMTWQDQSGNEKHATKSLGSPVLSSNSGNFHPTIIFDGNSGFDTDSLMIVHMFVVLKPSESVSANTNFQVLGRKNHSSSTRARVLGFGNKTVMSSNDSSAFASSDRIRINGKTNTSLSNTSFNIISIDAENKGGVKDVYKLGQKSSGTSYDNLNGEIAEIICYSSKKTGIELAKIESYLSVKYGITISNNNGGVNGDYYNSNGDLIWDASANSSYHYDVIGIGKDNTNKLNQKQSKTIDNKLTIFVDDLKSSNISNTGTITNNQSFVMVGHNNASLKSDSIIDLESPSEIKHRLAREWKITNTNFDDNFNLEIEWDSTGTFDLSDVRLLVDDDGDFTNADVYGPADGLTFRLGSIIVEDVNSGFIPKGSTKYITIGSVDELTVLPVDLLYFKGEQNGTNVDLKWETGSEINSDYFEVLHSTNGFDFKKIGRLNAAGNSTSCKKYELTHYNTEQGINYYKLKQYDFGGRYEEYEKIMVLFDYVVDDYEFLVYPNPNNDNGVVYLKSDYTGEVNIHIFDMKGRVVRKELINIKQNTVETIKDLNLPTGIYPFVISSPNNSFLSKTFKLIIN